MGWFRSSVAAAAIVAVASAPLAASFAQVAAAQDAVVPDGSAQESLEDLVGRDRAEVAALPVDQQLDEEALDAVVAPVALYPDALLAQVLVAATYPLQIVKADRLLDETEGLSDDEVAQKIAEQDWDPSVMVLLSGFPTVVQRMAADLDWTEQLGAAMVGQDQDVLAAVQRMRTQALDTGWLKSNEAQVVERRDDVVTVRPANPDVVYVPSYDSSLAYTTAPTAQTYVAPSTNPLANPVVAGAMAFGAALLVQQLFKDDDDDNRDNQGWNSYWRQPEPFDWQDRQFYPRAGRGWQRDGDNYAWSRERNDHWDRRGGGWNYDAQARADRERERRDAVAWTRRPGAEGLGHVGNLRTVARERPPLPPKAAARPAPPKPGARPANRKPPVVAGKPAPKPAATAARPDPKPGAKPAPRVAAKPKPDAKPAKAAAKPKPGSKPAAAKPKPDAKPAKAAAKPDAKPAVKPAAKPKPDPKPATKAAAKPKPKPEAKPAAKPKPEAKAAAKPKPVAKPAQKVSAKPAPKPVAKPAAKPAPAAAKQPAPKKAQAKPAPKPAAKKKPACKPGDKQCAKQNG